GEDDLDAPDLPSTGLSAEAQTGSLMPAQGLGGLDQPVRKVRPNGPLQTSERRTHAEKPKAPILPPEPSANLRDQLISELAQLSDAEAPATWAHRVLPLKNRLSAADAQTIE